MIPNRYPRDENSNATSEIEVVSEVLAKGEGTEANPEIYEWVRDNVESIREVTKEGRHSTAIYPASGRDALRVAFAYDVDEIVAIDTEDISTIIERDLQEADLSYDIDEKDNEKTIVLQTPTGNKVIRCIQGDARVILRDIESKVDIWHIYLPTGADTPIETAEGAEEFRDIRNYIDPSGYNRVNQGGFLVLEEKSLMGDTTETPQTILRALELEEIPIIRRHPYQITTSYTPNPDSIKQKGKKGYIYKKAKEIPEERLKAGIEALYYWRDLRYYMERTRYGELPFSREKSTQEDDYTHPLVRFLQATNEDIHERVQEMIAEGIPGNIATDYEHEVREFTKDTLTEIQAGYKHFIAEFSGILGRMEAKEITQQQAFEELGIARNAAGKMHCERHPVAITYLRGSDRVKEDIAAFARSDITQFLRYLEQ